MWPEAWAPHQRISRTSFAESKGFRCTGTSPSCGFPGRWLSSHTRRISRRSRSPWGSPATVTLPPPFGERSVTRPRNFGSQRVVATVLVMRAKHASGARKSAPADALRASARSRQSERRATTLAASRRSSSASPRTGRCESRERMARPAARHSAGPCGRRALDTRRLLTCGRSRPRRQAHVWSGPRRPPSV